MPGTSQSQLLLRSIPYDVKTTIPSSAKNQHFCPKMTLFVLLSEYRAFKKVKYFALWIINNCIFALLLLCNTIPCVIYAVKENWQQILHSGD